jgi:hypothetical protein
MNSAPKRSTFSTFAIASPLLGFILVSAFHSTPDMSFGITPLAAVIVGAGAGGALGLVLAVVAAIRRERTGLVVLAVLLCLPPATLLLVLRFG